MLHFNCNTFGHSKAVAYKVDKATRRRRFNNYQLIKTTDDALRVKELIVRLQLLQAYR